MLASDVESKGGGGGAGVEVCCLVRIITDKLFRLKLSCPPSSELLPKVDKRRRYVDYVGYDGGWGYREIADSRQSACFCFCRGRRTLLWWWFGCQLNSWQTGPHTALWWRSIASSIYEIPCNTFLGSHCSCCDLAGVTLAIINSWWPWEWYILYVCPTTLSRNISTVSIEY